MRRAAAGFSLIDVLVVIVLLGIVSVTLVTVSTRQSRQSADVLKTRQMLAFAQGLLDEVRHMPFTFCDANDARVGQATRARVGGTDCASQVDQLGPEPGEARFAVNPGNRFDGVSDYHGFAMPGPGCAGLCDVTGAVVNANTALAGCSATVATTPQAMPNIAALDADGHPRALRIVVTMRCPGVADVHAQGLRVRHAPNRL